MTIHTAASFHVPIIQDIAKRSWQHTYAQILSPKQHQYMFKKMYSTPLIQAQMEDPNWHYVLFADETNTFVAFVGYEHHHQFDTTKLHRLYVVPEYMKRGFGKKALEHVKLATKSAGDHRIILSVNKHNSAQQFYESQGFTIYDNGVFDIGNGFVMDDYLMEIDLSNDGNSEQLSNILL